MGVQKSYTRTDLLSTFINFLLPLRIKVPSSSKFGHTISSHNLTKTFKFLKMENSVLHISQFWFRDFFYTFGMLIYSIISLTQVIILFSSRVASEIYCVSCNCTLSIYKKVVFDFAINQSTFNKIIFLVDPHFNYCCLNNTVFTHLNY